MKKIMLKSICALAVVSMAVLVACSQNIFNFYKSESAKWQPNFDADGYWNTEQFKVKINDDNSYAIYAKNSVYGAYLAGRVAHLRQDFDQAAEYYKIVIEKDPDNVKVNRSIYVILASLGQIDQAAVYAQKEIDNQESESVAPLILAVKNFVNEDYAVARKNVDLIKEKVHKILINPLFDAWSFAGENNEKAAIASIDKITNDAGLASLKLFHKAMIYDYLNNKTKADETYETLVKKHPQDITFRYLEIITDFYVRNGDKEKAHKIFSHYHDNSMLALLLKSIDSKINANDINSPAIINTPQKGLAEALFNIGTLFRMSSGGTEFAQIYTAAATYLNPDYDISKIALANILEELGLLNEANRYYMQINKESGSYFIAKIKLIENYNTLKDYVSAEKTLRKLLKEHPDNTQLLNDLGDIMVNQNKFNDAIKIYLHAINSMKENRTDNWPIFYSLAVAYDKNKQPEKAEEYLQKALELSQRNPNILNYLGYSWLNNNKNTDEAVHMIVEAYNQYPYEGHIIDSLGWAYFRLGNYKKAIEYLERASDINPGNAVISDHLGDAYWFGGRKNEAVFQWKHAMVLKEDAEMLDKKNIQDKIENGNVENIVLHIKDKELEKVLHSMSLTEK